MATVLNVGSASSAAFNNNLTVPVAFGPVLANQGTVTEASVQQTIRSAGTASMLYARVSADANTGTKTVKYRIGAANGNQVISIGNAATGEFQDTVNTDVCSAGDKDNYQLVTPNAGGTVTFESYSTQFAATTNTASRWATSFNGVNANTASTTYYPSATGGRPVNTNTTEANAQTTVLTAGTFKNGYFNVSTNARTNSTTVNFRKNTANGNMTMSVNAAATGQFEDTSNTDSVSVSDLVNWAFTLGTTNNNFLVSTMGCDLVTTDSTFQHTCGEGSDAITVNASAVNYQAVAGRNNATTTTEAKVQVLEQLGATYSKISINVTTNTVSNAGTCTFRKNGGNGNQSASITASTTGIFTDAVNTDVCVATDEINTQVTAGTSGTSTIFAYVALKATLPTGVVVNANFFAFM
jgi:hypothetical protein